MNWSETFRRTNDKAEFRGHCIYCGPIKPAARLTIEHIIPEMIGGQLTLEAASCDDCSEKTSAFEGHACQIYLPIRRQLGFPSKRRTARDRLRKVGERFVIKAAGHKIKVPIEEFPALAIHIQFGTPGLLTNAPLQDAQLSGGIHGISMLPDFGERLNRLKAKYRADSIEIVGMEQPEHRQNSDAFGRMLAKIAHSFVVAIIGLGNFTPFLTNIVVGQPPYYQTHFIGSSETAAEPKDLHEISLAQDDWGRPDLVIVRIRLFANLKGPAHYVIVGSLAASNTSSGASNK